MAELVSLLRALAHGTRYRIISLLLTQDFCVGALAGRLGLSDAAVSQHLRVLREAGLVKGERKGYWTHYRVQRDVLKKLATALNDLATKPMETNTSCTSRAKNPGGMGDRCGYFKG
ncbi:MAG: winged helix-turn-helix transcriptional regulator [Firmicutes bacterium]|nr:winged helix-turn-helix transcriptional regulator [Bacillota bacterium]